MTEGQIILSLNYSNSEFKITEFKLGGVQLYHSLALS